LIEQKMLSTERQAESGTETEVNAAPGQSALLAIERNATG
jgi:hypothetical protein